MLARIMSHAYTNEVIMACLLRLVDVREDVVGPRRRPEHDLPRREIRLEPRLRLLVQLFDVVEDVRWRLERGAHGDDGEHVDVIRATHLLVMTVISPTTANNREERNSVHVADGVPSRGRARSARRRLNSRGGARGGPTSWRRCASRRGSADCPPKSPRYA